MKSLSKLCLFLFLMLMAPRAFCGTIGEESMAFLTMNDGLSGETVYRVMTSHNGETWVATNGGLNIFYGRQLHTYLLRGADGQSLEVYDLCEIADQYIYAATDGGLYRIEKEQGTASHVFSEIKRPLSLLATGDTLYVGSEEGLYIYDGQQLKHQHVDVSRQGLNNIVRQFVRCRDGRIWFLGRFDLNSYDPQTASVTRHPLPPPVGSLMLTQFACVGNGRFVVGTRGNGLFLCDLTAGTAERVQGVGNLVTTVQRSSDGHVCVATDGTGAYMLEVIGERLEVREHFHTDGDARHQLPSNGIYCYYRDPNGVNWFGFVRYGLAYTYYSGTLFNVFQAGDFTADGLNVRTYCRHGDDVVLGTQNGFYYVNATTGYSRFFSSDALQGGHIVNTVTWYRGSFYIGTFDGGLSEFDPQAMTVRKQTFSPVLDGISIGAVATGPDGRLWVGCSHGLIVIDQDRVVQHFTEQNSRIVSGLILSITFDAGGNTWLTGAKGCSLYSGRSHEIVDADFPSGFFHHESWMRGAAGHDGLVFMRTGPRTFYTNVQMTDYGELQFPVKFVDKWCRGFVDDMQGFYMVASERGLFCFDYSLEHILHFGYGEGLRGDFINDMGLSSDSVLWVATSGGLFFIDRSQLPAWRAGSRFHTRLYNIRQGTDLLTQFQEFKANEERRLRLSWNLTSEVLQAELLLPDYSKQTGRLYEYQIDGEGWLCADHRQPIVLSRLELGQHRLAVRLAGVEGTTSEYAVTVVPSFWAVSELILLLAGFAMLLWWLRYRHTTKALLSERNAIEDALVESEQLRMEREEEQQDADITGGQPLDADDVRGAKYQLLRMSDDECAEVVSRMRHYLETSRAYTNPELKRADLAQELHVSPAKLSYVFSMYLKENYYEFVNRYRLEAFKQMVACGDYKRFTITALSEQCGFKKSSFFSTFRKVEGMTPTEYLKRQNIKIEL